MSATASPLTALPVAEDSGVRGGYPDQMWTEELNGLQLQQVKALADRARIHDHVAPLNESAELALEAGGAAHFLHLQHGQLTGYLQWQPRYATAQLVVDPAQRRTGIGTTLVQALAQRVPPEGPAPTWGIWSFGDLPATRAFAAACGLVDTRGLLILSRPPLTEPPAAPAAGLHVRAFTPADTAELLEVNAAAFAEHPEQGALELADFTARTTEDWFDPAGLLLGFDADGLAGFHWTKRVGEIGEVYVLGIAPRAQGRGYGKTLLQAGLSHLSEHGVSEIELYVDRAEAVAVRMYESAGFRVVNRDVCYSPGPEFSYEWGQE